MASIGVIGAGTWGTALAVLLHNNGHQTAIWSALPEEIEEMTNTRRHKNLPEITIPGEIFLTADLEEAMAQKDVLIMAACRARQKVSTPK